MYCLNRAPLTQINSISFKRKSKHQSRFSLSNLIPTTLPSPGRISPEPPQYVRGRARVLREQASRSTSNTNLGLRQSNVNETKNGEPLDWYVEGPGRRVGYDDLTAIDWIFEYTKERQRLRILHSNTPGFVGYIRQLLDASHVWVVLILTGIAVGILAAAINIAGDWLGDIKSGFCRKGEEGGQFYLNKTFCCWGHDGSLPRLRLRWIKLTSTELAKCQDWTPWRKAFRISSKGGGYLVEYIFFILYSVCFPSPVLLRVSLTAHRRFSSLSVQLFSSSIMRSMLSIAEYPRSKPCWEGLLYGVSWEPGL